MSDSPFAPTLGLAPTPPIPRGNRLTSDETTTQPLDLDAAIAEFGADTPGRGAA